MQKNARNKPHVKFCGMTRPEDVEHAVALNVDAIGFILVPSAARELSLQQAQALRSLVPAHILAVAVVQNPEEEFVRHIIQQVSPDVLQFHGCETASFCEQFDLPFWKVITVKDQASTAQLTAQYRTASTILFDAWSVKGGGGHGFGFNWALIPNNKPLGQQFVLAGGLTSSSVARTQVLIRSGTIDMLDVSSGIECDGGPRGQKSQQKMDQFYSEIQSLRRRLIE